MLIAGAGNLGKHCLDMLIYDGYKGAIAFFDDNPVLPDFLYGEFRVFKTETEVKSFFQKEGADFVATVGNNRMREKMFLKIEGWGGHHVVLVSSKSYISALIKLESPVIVQPGVVVAHNVTFGKCCTIHANSVVGHDVFLGKYVSIATLTTLIGPCEIGDYTFIGTQVVIQSGVKIGKHAYIGTGKVVTTDVPDYGTLV